MAKTGFKSVDEYIASQTEAVRSVLDHPLPLSQPVPVKRIEPIAKLRAKDVAARENAKAPKKR
jgi:hypothetical protein